MADNVTLNSGSGGAVLAADDIASVWHQRVKIQYGTDGSATDVSDSNPLPVDDAGGSLTVDAPAGTPVNVQIGDGTDQALVSAAGALLVEADLGANNDVVVSGMAAENAAVSGNPVLSGGRYDSTPRTLGDGDVGAIALDADGAVHIADGGNTITVDGTVTANAGTDLNTSALALESGGNLAGAATSLAVIDDWDESDRAKVNVIAGQAGITAGAGAVGASTPRVTLASDDPAVVALQILDNAISGNEMQVDVVGALPAGTNNIGDVDVLSVAAGANLIGDVGISGARTSGGTTIFRSIDLDETEEEVKATAGQVYWIHAMNLAATKRFLKFYNATAANVTVGTTTPVLTFALPTTGDTNGAGFLLAIPNGIAFGTAITVAATTGVADADTGAPGANEVIVNIGYA